MTNKSTLDFVEYDKILSECKSISINKNTEYGCASLKLFNGDGTFVRIIDKIERLKTIYEDSRNTQVKSESMEDTLQDLINYCVYLIMIRRGKLEK